MFTMPAPSRPRVEPDGVELPVRTDRDDERAEALPCEIADAADGVCVTGCGPAGVAHSVHRPSMMAPVQPGCGHTIGVATVGPGGKPQISQYPSSAMVPGQPGVAVHFMVAFPTSAR
ncbi:hypothetical protein [Nocardia huaxiensis]|uniref:hypothetical protein n=1 Tax=Nocardia huaxiensis TaxID=2755382 RepID=UPI001E4778D2|nr:hypothetical protein [Nocardia huaxiensis]UFT00444.1 hypothetical protein LPY97_14835 [Nocardia huaxiensis]